ncbi:type II toxin-antitoxin system VapC family toxin [Desulfofundulus sp. TPOSR]|uniref:Ribonuclease VapC n=1 Tax=Desulfofundulus kuznetsovii (strain DSM 6115 / VKM B-1805 / 17) TaxID=760568 RepID=A0AAU8PEJ4_DESK7|nr:type II toxin-antitoxin system VapC family toxin [Desulfofundulus sp. TPOSR]AEG15785.1 PilT protein domain protein [Desulfofundulus kuznetsovii DSM 6115]NHM27594.1 type II toxin-antitoxin system VapC family toxin [Desulfofundulus sp. TPOSR]
MVDGKTVVLDTYAILALIEDEEGADTVAAAISDEQTTVYFSVINLGELYYILLRKKGERVAEEVLRNILLEESINIVEVPWPRVKEAARIKARGGLSYADSFVLELARELKAPVLTGDPEIQTVAKELDVPVIWVGSNLTVDK